MHVIYIKYFLLIYDATDPFIYFGMAIFNSIISNCVIYLILPIFRLLEVNILNEKECTL